MPCRSPVKQYWKPGDEWTFSRDEAAMGSIHRKLPCGVCRDCRIQRTTDWSIRCYHELQLHDRSCFVNPTFAEDPITLSRKPFQVFFRAMRDAGLRFQYFGCGEYGKKLDRPHGHIILFGLDFAADRYAWKRIKGNLYYRSPTLEKYWPHGHILLTHVSAKNAMYTAGYTSKKINGPQADEINPKTGLKHYERIDPHTGEIIEVMPEFVMASTKPAIGKRWLEKNYKEIYPADSVVMNGREYRVPKKYDEWLKGIDPEMHSVVMDNRAEYLKTQPRETDEQREYKARARDQKRKHVIPARDFECDVARPATGKN